MTKADLSEPLVQHPWWKLCLNFTSGDSELAWQYIQRWQEHGIPKEHIEPLLASSTALDDSGALHPPKTQIKNSNIYLSCFGTSLLDWQTHAWLQRCNLPAEFQLVDNSKETRIGLNLDRLENWLARPESLLTLSHFDCIWDPDPTRVTLFRALGIPAETLNGKHPANGWLDRQGDADDAMLTLGLPHPLSLAGNDAVLILGTSDGGGANGLQPPLHGWPEFDNVQIKNENSARLLAHWLEHCSRVGIQIVRINPTDQELERRGFESLTIGRAPVQLKAQFFHSALDYSALSDELTWRREGRPAPIKVSTPQPNSSTTWESRKPGSSCATICISLHNYQERIITALESTKAQTQKAIELIIVDDASTDDSTKTCLEWLHGNYNEFNRTLLLRHHQNSGLAAARNTAFHAAENDWCFVLDADNHIHPQAIERCLQIAKYANEKVAVVHPLVERINEAGLKEESGGLISGLSWQQPHFMDSNYIDAMALVRKTSWKAVNGYSHIEDGWEDYDFWCKLIDAGFHGLLCPQVLATYVCHSKSMIGNRTNRNVRRISRTLQSRHPWLDLPMAKGDA